MNQNAADAQATLLQNDLGESEHVSVSQDTLDRNERIIDRIDQLEFLIAEIQNSVSENSQMLNAVLEGLHDPRSEASDPGQTPFRHHASPVSEPAPPDEDRSQDELAESESAGDAPFTPESKPETEAEPEPESEPEASGADECARATDAEHADCDAPQNDTLEAVADFEADGTDTKTDDPTLPPCNSGPDENTAPDDSEAGFAADDPEAQALASNLGEKVALDLGRMESKIDDFAQQIKGISDNLTNISQTLRKLVESDEKRNQLETNREAAVQPDHPQGQAIGNSQDGPDPAYFAELARSVQSIATYFQIDPESDLRSAPFSDQLAAEISKDLREQFSQVMERLDGYHAAAQADRTAIPDRIEQVHAKSAALIETQRRTFGQFSIFLNTLGDRVQTAANRLQNVPQPATSAEPDGSVRQSLDQLLSGQTSAAEILSALQTAQQDLLTASKESADTITSKLDELREMPAISFDYRPIMAAISKIRTDTRLERRLSQMKPAGDDSGAVVKTDPSRRAADDATTQMPTFTPVKDGSGDNTNLNAAAQPIPGQERLLADLRLVLAEFFAQKTQS